MATFKKSEDYYLKQDLRFKIGSVNTVFPAGTPLTYLKMAPVAKNLDLVHVFNIKNSFLNIEVKDSDVESTIATFVEEAQRSAK